MVGLSGSGKSTIAALLMRFYDLENGRILLEGRDYTSFTPEELRRRVIMVPQTVHFVQRYLSGKFAYGGTCGYR